MIIVQGLKKIKTLKKKLDATHSEINMNAYWLESQDSNFSADTLTSLMQSANSIALEIESLMQSIHFTNSTTNMTLTLGKNNVTKTLSEWLTRRQNIKNCIEPSWQGLQRVIQRARNEVSKDAEGNNIIDPIVYGVSKEEVSRTVERLQMEIEEIDSNLEIFNAVHELKLPEVATH